jgi:hypothetical protein
MLKNFSMVKALFRLAKQMRSAIARKILPELIFYSSCLNIFPQEFVRSAHTFMQFLKNAELSPCNTEGDPVGIIVMPWVSTAVPWYSLTIAIGLAQKGKHVVLIWDDTCFPEPSVAVSVQNLCIGYVLDYLCQFFPVMKLSSEQGLSNRREDQPHLHKLADLNLIWYSRAASLANPDPYQLSSYQDKLSQILRLIRSLLSRIEFEYLLVPGGIYSSSSLFVYASKERSVRVATYDGGGGCLLCCSDGIAAYQSDIPTAFTKLWSSSQDHKQTAIALAKQEFQSRMVCKDHFNIQVLTTSQQELFVPTDILIPLNLEWDSAALGKHYLFENTIEWLLETVSFILANSDKSVVVRQHPCERLDNCQSYLGIEKILNQHFGDRNKFRFISATEEVNTYNLLDSASLVIPFTSTIGLEASAIGKNVLVAGANYYKDLGFVWAANSRQEYFDILLRALHNSLPIFPDQQDKGWLCYYLSALCNISFTSYNADLQDFWIWGNKLPSEVFSDPIISDVVEAIDSNLPFSWLRHYRNLSITSQTT